MNSTFCPLDIDPSSYSCANPYPNCTNEAAFQFASLWIITQAVSACPGDTRLFENTPFLNDRACRMFTTESWTPYPRADIWARLTTWKFPLLQLVAVFPRPPFTLLSEFFVLVHLLGDPISTINSLLLKVASCQSRAEFWRNVFNDYELMGHLLSYSEGGRSAVFKMWKGLAAIVDSFDEWGVEIGSLAQGFILDRLANPEVTEDEQRRFLDLCRLTTNALAADRSTKFLPIIVAQCFFISTIAIAFGRTKDSAAGPNPPTFINIEAHSIAYSSLYFWIIPAVIISSIIGASQTQKAIPRILGRFRNEVRKEFPAWFTGLRATELRLPDVDGLSTERRERSGGIYSWQPAESRTAVIGAIRQPYPSPEVIVLRGMRQNANGIANSLQPTDSRTVLLGENPGSSPKRTKQVAGMVLECIELKPGSLKFPLLIFASGALIGMLISYLVPPEGFECRHIGEIAITLAWVISACLNNLPLFPHLHSSDEDLAKPARRTRFKFILYKDILMTMATMGGIIATQIGVFNQCACYTLWGRKRLALPEIASVSKILFWRIHTIYPAIAFICVGFQLIVFPGLLLRQYDLAVRVFLQRDDDSSNWPRSVLKLGDWVKDVWVKTGKGLKSAGTWVEKHTRKLHKSRSGFVTPAYNATEQRDPDSTGRRGAREDVGYGGNSMEINEYRQRNGSDRIENIAPAYPP